MAWCGLLGLWMLFKLATFSPILHFPGERPSLCLEGTRRARSFDRAANFSALKGVNSSYGGGSGAALAGLRAPAGGIAALPRIPFPLEENFHEGIDADRQSGAGDSVSAGYCRLCQPGLLRFLGDVWIARDAAQHDAHP